MTTTGDGPELAAGIEVNGGPHLGHLVTEEVRPELATLDLLGTAQIVAVMAADCLRATEAVAAAASSISAAVDAVSQRLGLGGRLVYVGAGTAGRLAVLDAAELGPTFNVPEGMVEAVMAGGDNALRHAAEGAEDDKGAGAAALARLGVGPADAVIGVSASGRTPFVLGAIECARSAGAATIGLSCNRGAPLSHAAEIAVELIVGGEVIAGSSRLNAGTAQKITLNAISTATMVRLGKTYGNLMVDVRPTNAKLRDRAVRIVQSVTGVAQGAARAALEEAGWDTKLASLVAATGQDVATVAPALKAAQGRLREAISLVGASEDGPGTRPTGPGLVPSTPAPASTEVVGERRPGPAPAPGRALATRTWARLGVGAAFVDGALVPGDVAVHDGIVVAVGLPAQGPGIAAPGLVDLQVNGYAGTDAAHASVDELKGMSRALARDGVLAYQASLISGDLELTRAAVERVAAVAQRQGGAGSAEPVARILGTHLEGPFLSPRRAGTHPVERLREPDRGVAEALLAPGAVTMVTLAPELPGALDLVRYLTSRGIVVSLGHSAATAQQAAEAVSAGATVVTHLYNAMSPVSARAPGLIGLALTDSRLRVQVIADGKHVADELVRLAFTAAPGRCSVVTDATSFAGRGAGEPRLGDVAIEVSGGVARRPDGTIAGGASTLMDGLRHLVSLSIGLEQALDAVTAGPARALGRQDIGYLRVGEPANLIVLDDGLGLRDVLIGGRSVL